MIVFKMFLNISCYFLTNLEFKGALSYSSLSVDLIYVDKKASPPALLSLEYHTVYRRLCGIMVLVAQNQRVGTVKNISGKKTI